MPPRSFAAPLSGAEFLGIEWTNQLIFDGVVSGLVFGLLALGIVLIFRATRVINFAVGNMGIPASALFALMILNWSFPFWIALVIALVVGTLTGLLIELVVIRRLFTAPRVIVLVATLGVAQLMLAITLGYPDIDAAGADYPVALGSIWEDVGGLRITGAKVTIIVLVPLIAAGLGWFLNRTTFGKTVQAAADNPDLARLSGISPRKVSMFVWTVAGFLATISAIMLSGDSGSTTGFENLGPSTMVRALAAAVLAGMRSFPLALLAGVGIGVLQALVQFNYLDQTGLVDFILFLAIAIAVYFYSRGERVVSEPFSFAPKPRPVPIKVRSDRVASFFADNVGKLFVGLLLVAGILLPFFFTRASQQLSWASVLAFAMCAASVTVVTGWSGQLSLSQMAFAGLGGLIAALLTRTTIPFTDSTVPFVLAILAAALIVAGLAALIGVGALRVRGLMLAVSTFAFGVAAEKYLYRTSFLSDDNSSSVPFRRGSFFFIDLDSQQSYYYVTLASLVVVLVIVARLRSTGIGRNTIAVRDNVNTAAGYTVPPAKTRLRAFALAGGIAAFGGGLLSGLIQNVPLTERFFQNNNSLEIVSIAVIGGLGTTVGPLLGSVFVQGSRVVFEDNDLVPLLTSSIGLLVLLLYIPGGFAQIGYTLRDKVLEIWNERLPDRDVHKSETEPPATLTRAQRGPLPEGVAPLVAHDISVHFGGNIAVQHVSIDVQPGEVVGLIGTNGAGKSTLMNAIGGYVPADGTVELLGRKVSRRSAAARARLGLGRTFQAALLFPELTVRETVQVALEGRGRTGFLSTALFMPWSFTREATKRREADELIDFLGLGRYAESYIADLSTGTRRIVEIAGLLALDASVLCLDEPTAGVAQRETEAFGPLLLRIRAELDASVLIIEHDMPLIMSVSDRVYCLEAGSVIAEGAPDDVRHDPAVVASYLGTDDRAIARSDV